MNTQSGLNANYFFDSLNSLFALGRIISNRLVFLINFRSQISTAAKWTVITRSAAGSYGSSFNIKRLNVLAMGMPRENLVRRRLFRQAAGKAKYN